MRYLDSNIYNQVASPRVIEANLGQANRKMMIFSGIAMPDWVINDDERIYTESVTVNLRRTILAVEQYTIAVGLASIGNDDTLFLIATDTATLDIDSVSQELLLKVDMALQGEKTSLSRFGYQVVTIVTTQSTGISGVIKWNKEYFDPRELTDGMLAQTFSITANQVEHIAPPGGFVHDKLTPVAFGVTTGLTAAGNEYVVGYEIKAAPYNLPLVVKVEVGTFFMAPGTPSAAQISGPNPVVLTLATPGVDGVDFLIATNVVR